METIERALDSEELHRSVQALDERQVTLAMPRFRFASSFRLQHVLAKMGVSTAFGPHADFSRISGEPDFAVSELLHKALVDVTESGAEALAMTGGVLAGGVVREPPPVVVRVDRPFVFLIYDGATGAVLFAGRVMDPRQA